MRFVLLLTLLACSNSDPPPEPPAPAPAAVAPRPDAKPADDSDKIKITIGPSKPRKLDTLAKRCALVGDPLANAKCGGGSVAVDTKGRIYVVDGGHVRRYERAAGDPTECRLALDPAYGKAGLADLPPENSRPQSLDGPVYMRSGGPDWKVVGSGDTIYAHDYLGGLFRVDRGKSEKVCADVFGFATLAVIKTKLLIARHGIEQVAPPACKPKSAKLDDKSRGGIFAVHDQLYVADGTEVRRFTGATAEKLDAGHLCYADAVMPCGDGACIIDHNCPKLIALGADGKVAQTLEDDALFTDRPYGLGGAATAPDGTVYLYALHKERGMDAPCEGAIYAISGSAFSPAAPSDASSPHPTRTP